jgi:WD40 repeat protein
VYALGAILYELLTGQPPFQAAAPLDVLMQVMEKDPVPPRRLRPGVPRDLEVVCLKCLGKEPAQRYASAAALAEDLERFVAGQPITARAAAPWERGVKWLWRHPAPAALAVVSVLALLAVAGVLLSRHSNARLESVNAQLESASKQLQTALHGEKAAKAQAWRYLYVSQMTLAERAQKEGDIGRVMQLLRSVIPESPEQEDLRGWEWHHLWRKYHGEQSRLRGHTEAVTAVAFSPDDRLLASGSADRMVKLWSTITGKEMLTLVGHRDRVTSVAFSPDGKRLASGSADRTVRVWDTSTGQELLCLTAHDGKVTCVAYSPDGRQVASASEDKSVRLWDAATGQATQTFSGHLVPVSGVGYSPDGKTIATVGHNSDLIFGGETILWLPSTGQTIRHLKRQSPQTSVAFSPDGKLLATGEFDNSGPRVKVWEVSSAKELLSLEGHHLKITQVAFSPGGKHLASASLDQTVKLWDLTTGKEECTLHEEASVFGVAISPDGLRVAAGSEDHTVKLFTPPGNEARTLSPHKGRIETDGVVFSPDGKQIAACWGPHKFAKNVTVWDVATGKALRSQDGLKGYYRFDWSPDGKYLGLDANGVLIGAAAGEVNITRLDVTHPPSGFWGVAFSRDGRRLATAGAFNNVLEVWDIATGQLLRRFRTSLWPTCVAFNPDGDLLAAGTAADSTFGIIPGELRIWDLNTGGEVPFRDGVRASVWGVTFSPDGKRLAAATGEYNDWAGAEVRVWDTATRRAIYVLKGHSGCVWGVSFSPDGRRLASAAADLGTNKVGEAKIWDMNTGQEVCTLKGHARAVVGIAFSPCGRRLATASRDGTLKIWDGTPLAETPARDPEPVPE